VFKVGSGSLDDTQVATLKLDNENYLRFQVDTGAQCNVVPLDLYKKATNDSLLQKVTTMQQNFTAYGGTAIPVCGTPRLRVWRGEYHCKLDCKLVINSWEEGMHWNENSDLR